jgi:dTDP-4-dehydrorhamnose 3,5-epimerase
MIFKETSLRDLLICEPRIHKDGRGYFFESYNEKAFQTAGLNYRFVQDNESSSARGVLRGLHYQVEPMAQAKLVRVISGEVFDVAVDIRQGSPTFGHWFGTILSGENKLQLLIPRGFAHGFLVLADHSVFCYKCDNTYSREHEHGIVWNDPQLAIEWPLPADRITLSEKDKALPRFADALKFAQ